MTGVALSLQLPPSLSWRGLALFGLALGLSSCGTFQGTPAASMSPSQAVTSQALLPTAPQSSAAGQKIAVALYSYPLDNSGAMSAPWRSVVVAQAQTGRVALAVVNVNNGPVARAVDQASYLKGISALRAGGVKPFGYIDTNYATRSLAKVQSDANLWISKFGVTSFFLDQVKQGCSAATKRYYSQVASFLRAKGADVSIILNPGAAGLADQCLMDYGDILVSFEAEASAYASTSPPAWTKQYGPERFWNIAHSVGSLAQQQNLISLAQQRSVGYLQLTSATMPNPYDGGGLLWNDFVSLIAASAPSTPL